MKLGLDLAIGMTGGPKNEAPTDIAWGGSHSVAENSSLGTVVGGALTATDPELDPVTFTLVDDANGYFDVSADTIIVSGVLDYETATTHDITVRALDDHGNFYDETFSVTVTDVDETPPDDPLPDDSNTEIVDDGTFTNPPIDTVVDGAVKLHGKKAAGSSGKFIFSIGALQAGYRYTMQYDPDFSLMTLQGKKAFVGFGLKQANDFRLTGLKGDGTTGLHAYEVSGDNLWNATSGFTVADGGAALHGTQAGPNWLQFEVSADGETYTLRSSADGVTWEDEFTDVVPDPFDDVITPTQSGIAAFFDATDTGSFSIAITLWTAEVYDPFAGVLTHNTADQVPGLGFDGGTAQVWDTDNVDTNTLHDTGSNTNRITIPSGLNGRFGVLSASVSTTVTGGRYYVGITKGGTGNFVAIHSYATPDDSGTVNDCQVSTPPLLLTTGDIFEVWCFSAGAGSLTRKASSSFSLNVVG